MDDLLTTGGTAVAGAQLIRSARAVIEHALFVIDLAKLGETEALGKLGMKAKVDRWSNFPVTLFGFS